MSWASAPDRAFTLLSLAIIAVLLIAIGWWAGYCRGLRDTAPGAAGSRPLGGDASGAHSSGEGRLDATVQAVQTSRAIVHTAFNSIDQGICVIDADLRLVAWNERYVDLLHHPRDEVYVGKPIAELIASSPLCAGLPPAVKARVVEERLEAIRRQERQLVDQEWPDGLIVKVVARPLSTGDYIMSLTDVTQVRMAARALAHMNEELEQRVRARTGELTRANAALTEAKALAERVIQAQNRFVAAASHDLLQPMHAARLYLGVAIEGLAPGDRTRQLLTQSDLAIETADRLLKALLDLSRIEIGGLVPDLLGVDLDALLTALQREFEPLAEEHGVVLHVVRTHAWARSNPDLLRSVLQNLLSNAIRYAPGGRIVLCARRDGGGLRVEVRDNGPGISPEDRQLIFREFTRLPDSSAASAGAGLGLAIAKRICSALDHHLSVRSEAGRGSVFSVLLPRADAGVVAHGAAGVAGALCRLRVLCVEDRPEVLKALSLLIEGWGAAVTPARTVAEALDHTAACDAVIADYHLGEGPDGLDLLEAVTGAIEHRLILTADTSDRVRERAQRLGVATLSKPVKPASLRAFLNNAARPLPKPAGPSASAPPVQ